jgi:hypothetical protein
VGEVGENGFEVEMEVGNVANDQAAGGEFALIEGEGFAGDEVDGDGVGAEGVEHDEIEGAGGSGGESETGITGDDAEIRRGIAQKREIADIAREAFDDRIDLEISPRLAGSRGRRTAK